jgi:hypothetical protein
MMRVRTGDIRELLDRKDEFQPGSFFTAAAAAHAAARRLLRFFRAPVPVMASCGETGTR